MFKEIDSNLSPQTDSNTVDIFFEGEKVSVPSGISVAAALLYLDIGFNRFSVVTGSPRASYCMMGVCFECLVTINDKLNQRGCQTTVYQGISISRQPQVSGLDFKAERGE